MSNNEFDQDYNSVKDRLGEFRAKHPEGSLQQKAIAFVEVDGVHGVLYTAEAFRAPDDTRPGQGTGWCPFPGTTEFTLGSEVQNAETSAWGRAIVAALAADTTRGISADHQSRTPGATFDPAKLVAYAGTLRGAGPVEALWAALAGLPQETRDAVAAVATAKRKTATTRTTTSKAAPSKRKTGRAAGAARAAAERAAASPVA
ncbi:hypothetical protein QN357_01595 [Cryobacterium sp. RTC2.1]|uniref:hypothetical protein n=1 Tax=Cryobacterium sp. RTC2.1 TaxID=3048634 RepID=UPI002B22D3C6|nr:hypothetical protein [Cryobacterium sp. RTC2.1]MEB0001630.1 hypothetical protein [Cryobacterium sp. RTC2.1]